MEKVNPDDNIEMTELKRNLAPQNSQSNPHPPITDRKSKVKLKVDEELSNPVALDDSKKTAQRLEKDLFGATSEEIITEYFDEFQKTLDNNSDYLLANLTKPISDATSPEYAEILLKKYLEHGVRDVFSYNYDEGQICLGNLLSLEDIPIDLIKFVIQKRKNIIQLENQSTMDENFKKAKKKLYDAIRENDLLELKIEMLKKIKSFREKNLKEGSAVQKAFKDFANSLKNPIDYQALKADIDDKYEKLKQLEKKMNKKSDENENMEEQDE